MNSFSWPLLRDAGRLILLQHQPHPTVGKRRRDRGVDSGWRLQRLDFDQVPATVGHAALLPVREALARLSRATSDAETLAALLLVLCASRGTGARCAAPLPTGSGSDLRPWLGDADAMGAVLRSLGRFLPQSLRLLAAHRWLPLDEMRAMSTAIAGIDLFTLARCREMVVTGDAESSTRRGRDLLVLAPPGRPSIEARTAAKAIEALDLHGADDGLGLAVRVWVLSGSGWLQEVVAMDRDDHVTALRGLVATGAAAKAPPVDVRRLITTLRHVGRVDRRRQDLRWIIKGLHRGASAGALASALRVAQKALEGDPVTLDHAPAVTWAMPGHLFVWLAERISRGSLRRVWRACSRVPGLVGVMASVRWIHWWPNWAIEMMVRTLVKLAERMPAQPPMAPSDLRRRAVMIVTTAHRRGVTDGIDWIDALEDLFTATGSLSVHGCDQAIALSLRLQKLLGGAATDVTVVLRAMIDVAGEQWLGLANGLTDDWFRRIAEVAATWVRRDRACDGIRRLDRRAFDMLWESCQLFPARWFNLMQEVACLPKGRLRAVVDSAAEHPLLACPLPLDHPRHALVLVDSAGEGRCKANPVSARLRAHAAGDRVLPGHLLRHDLEALRRGWLEARLHVVDELVQDEVWRAFPGLKRDAGITGHSLKMALTVDGNDRPLRRLIRCCAGGEPDWMERHPVNRQWQSQLGETRAARWREGIAAVRLLPSFGEVIIAPEDDPQEVLRMGSAVGSCLSLGAFNSHSAAANALDANKRVVYARTRDGKVVGRQLLAISEEKRLVCFSPYPSTLRGPLPGFFEDYDQVLAGHLDLPLHRAGEYTIKPLVAQQWYDDGLWDRMWRAA